MMVNVIVNKKTVCVTNDATVATAIFSAGDQMFRRSTTGEPRSPLCGMGICFECRVSINGVKHQRSCQILVSEGMSIETDE
jgi:D-hydroxyproline dehydrogenase subunit gamma